MRRARAIAEHRRPDRPSIRIAAGDRVTLGDRDADWTQFVWTTLASGLGGWVPSALFDNERGPATATAGYDTSELDLEAGDTVILHHELAEWWWVEKRDGERGWVPARVLAFLD